jgi:RimJ/RimL family protein N-acetyltransferase
MNCNCIIEYKNIRLRSLKEDDLKFLMMLRNDESVSKYLSKIGKISFGQQLNWYKNVIERENEVVFAIEDEHKKIVGSCSIYDINNEVAEWGKIMVDLNMSGKKIGYNAMIASLYYGFEFLSINNFFARVYDKNVTSKKNLIKAGFDVIEERFVDNKKELLLKLEKERYYNIHNDKNLINVTKD